MSNIDFYDSFNAFRAVHPADGDRTIRKAQRKDKIDTIMGRLMGGMPKDYISQQGANFLWESPIIDLSPVGKQKQFSEAEAQAWVNKIRKAYGRKTNVTVRFDDSVDGAVTSAEGMRVMGMAVVTKQRIRINPTCDYSNPWVCTHEACHTILNNLLLIGEGEREEHNEHGPSFVRLLIDAATRFFDMDFDQLTDSAQKAGLVVAEDLPEELRKYGFKKLGREVSHAGL